MPWHTRPTAASAIARVDDATDARGKRPGRPPAFLLHDFEAVLPTQWFARQAGYFQPEKRLMLAALTDAIELFIQDPAPGNARRTMLQQAAAEWIRSNDRRWPFSFLNICETLGLEPCRLRERLESISEQGRRTCAPECGRRAQHSCNGVGRDGIPSRISAENGNPHRRPWPSP